MRSIRAKIVTLVVAAVGSAVLLVSLAAAWIDLTHRFASRRQELQGIAAAIATTLAEPLKAGNADTLRRTLGAVGRIPGLSYARVQGRDGRVVEQFGFGVVVTRDTGALAPNPDIGPLTVVYLATYPVAVPIVSGGVRIGELMLIADLSGLRGAALDSLLSALLAGSAAMAIGLLLSWRLQARIVAPVTGLTGAMQEVTRRRDYAGRVPRTSNDEIGTLVDAFNGMLAEVRQRDAAIARHAEHLESEVEARTADLVSAKQIAEAATAAKSDFLATMSHEIRTPLNGMLVMAELMATSQLTPRMQRNAEVLLGSGRTLLALLNDILDFSKIEAGRLELESVPVDVRDVVDHVLRLFGERAAERGLDLAAHVAGDVPASIAADPVRLTQVLSNLVNNALKFTERGGVAVHVRAAGAGDSARSARILIEVADTGIGIAADKLATIFDAFTQADASTTRRFGGTGIGLAICRRLIDAMGGELSVASEEGVGTTFSVDVPIEILEPARRPQRCDLAVGHGIVLGLAPSQTRDALTAAIAERGVTVRVVAPEDLAREGAIDAAHVVFVRRADLVRMPCPVRGEAPVLVVLSGLGEVSGERELPDDVRVLDLPLAHGEVAACLDAILAGESATSGSRPAALRATAPDVSTVRFAGLRVLAADDSAVNREVLSEALARLGATVVCVEDGAAALAAVRDGDFDVVLMDCGMPVMDGFEATRAIRAFERQAGRAPLPIVALTAHVVGVRATSWRDAGMTGYLTKPYTLRSLAAGLARAVPEHGVGGAPQASEATAETGPPIPAALIATSEAHDGPLIDSTVLDGIRDIDTSGGRLLEKVVALYAGHAPRALATLLAACDQGGPAAVADAAHALKSLSRNVGAVAVGDVCEGIEGPARGGDLTALTDACGRLSALLPPTLQALAAAARTGTAERQPAGEDPLLQRVG